MPQPAEPTYLGMSSPVKGPANRNVCRMPKPRSNEPCSLTPDLFTCCSSVCFEPFPASRLEGCSSTFCPTRHLMSAPLDTRGLHIESAMQQGALSLNNRKVVQCRTSRGLLLTQPPPCFRPDHFGCYTQKTTSCCGSCIFFCGLLRILE